MESEQKLTKSIIYIIYFTHLQLSSRLKRALWTWLPLFRLKPLILFNSTLFDPFPFLKYGNLVKEEEREKERRTRIHFHIFGDSQFSIDTCERMNNEYIFD